MTNNPTIDGVSRELLERLSAINPIKEVELSGAGSDVCPACYGCGDWNSRAGSLVSIDPIEHHKDCPLVEVRALLDAQAVERQDDHSKSTAPRYDTIVIRGAKGNTVPQEVDGGEVVSWSQGHELAAFDALRELVEDLAAGDDSYPEEITERAQFALSLMERRREKGWDADE